MREYFYRVITNQDQSLVGRILKGGLYSLSFIYCFVVKLILWFYKIGLLKKKRLSKPVISVGNITWGGTGKTPLVEWILKYLREKKIKPAVLIRGYMVKDLSFPNALVPTLDSLGRNPDRIVGIGNPQQVHLGTGPDEAMAGPPTEAFGGDSYFSSDEAQMLHQSFPDVPILVGRGRIKNAHRALQEHPVDVFVLDDGFQHWKLERDLDMVVIDSLNPFGNGCLIPRGILREPLKSLARADIFILTKTDWGQENVAAIKNKLHFINPDAPIVETVHRAAALFDLCDPFVKESLEFLKGKPVAALCGIGQPDSFLRFLKSLEAEVVVWKTFADHHTYDEKDLSALLDVCREKKVQTIVTTQKDAVKLRRHSARPGERDRRAGEQSPKGEVKSFDKLRMVRSRSTVLTILRTILSASKEMVSDPFDKLRVVLSKWNASKDEVEPNLIGEEIPALPAGRLRFAQDDGQKIQLLSVKMEIQITKGYEDFCGRISRLLGC